MKKVLSIVLNNFKNDSRVLKECQSLNKVGYDVTVVALHEGDLPEKERVGNIFIHRIRLKTRKWPKKFLIQLIKYVEFAIRTIVKYRNKMDIIHCNDLGPLPTVVILKYLSKKKPKVVYDAHELETEVKGLSGLRKRLKTYLEKKLIQYVDEVITVSESIAKEYQLRYKIKKPDLVLNCPHYREVSNKDKFRKVFGIREDQTIFLYQGGLTEGRGIELILKAFSETKRDDISLIMMGYGPLEKLVINMAKENDNIYYHPVVPPTEVLNYTASADIGVSFIKNTCLNYYYCLPNKLFEYVMAGLPVLVSNSIEMKKLVSKYKCGKVIEEESIDGIIKGMKEIMQSNLAELSVNSRKLSKKYNWENQEKVLLDVYRRIS